jgi:hypothetical protein
MPDLIRHPENAEITGFRLSRPCHIWENDAYSLFGIPGLTGNPVLFQSITILDAGSSPA